MTRHMNIMSDDEERKAKRVRLEKSKEDDGTSEPRCIECDKNPMTVGCRRGSECRSRSECMAWDEKAGWCESCAGSNGGFQCPVCKKYQCQTCEKKDKVLAKPGIDIDQFEELIRGNRAFVGGGDGGDGSESDEKSSVASDTSWNPETDTNVYKKECQHCDRTVCRCFQESCFKSCVKCGQISCNECVQKLNEKWLFCNHCEDKYCNGADGFTPGFFEFYCTNCKHVGGSCDESDCEDGKLEYVGE